jgi:Holliday junction resolvase
MSNYTKGRRFEYKVMRLLEKVGYHVYRTAGSHGDFDVIAWHSNEPRIRFIQVKSGKPATKKEREHLRTLRAIMPRNANVELWEYPKRGQEKIYVGAAI